MIVVQCWDDGVASDARLVEILRRHGARATFNLNAGLHDKERKFGWRFKETEVWRLGWNEMKEIYSGFTIANHTLRHPRLEQIPIQEAVNDIQEGRKQLQQFFQQPVRGFAYPFGTYNEAVMEAVCNAGHGYARTVKNVDYPFPPDNPMAFHPCCHFLAPDFWSRFDRARNRGLFYFWGHSYEIIGEPMWQAVEEMMARISGDPEARWACVQDLFPERKP